MKISKLKRKNSILLFASSLLIAIIGIISCEKDTILTSHEEKISQNDIDLIIQMGFDTVGLEQRGCFYIVEGDIMLRKDKLNEYSFSRSNGRTLRQARVNSLIDFDNQIDITVRVDNSIPTSESDNWRTEIQQAINDWNGIADTRIHLVYTTNSIADITISSDGGVLYDGNYSNFVLAQASWPLGGNAGPTIIINLNAGADRIFTSSQKRYNMVHELGHCLGLRHTNWSGLGESNGIGIPGTPNTGSNPDPNSVMNGGTALNSWIGFSNYDKIAIQNLYPGLKVNVSGPSCLPSFGSATWTASGVYGDGNYTYEWHYLIRRGVQKIKGVVYSNNLTLDFQSGDSFSAGVTVLSSGETANGGTGDGFMYECFPFPL